jgi:hypothetical protein
MNQRGTDHPVSLLNCRNHQLQVLWLLPSSKANFFSVHDISFPEFYIPVTVHLGIILINNQLDAISFICIYIFIYLDSLHVSSNLVLIIRIVKCINTSSGMSLGVGDRPVCRSVSSFQTCITDGHLHRLTYQMMY